MMKIKVVPPTKSKGDFEKQVSELSDALKGFATQTHVVVAANEFYYSAVIFYKE